MTATVLPPDGSLRRPKRTLPRGTVDCHAHIFDRFERYPLAPGRKYSPPACTREAWMELHAALKKALSVESVREKYRSMGVEIMDLSQAGFAAYVKTDFEKWRLVAREANIVVE